MGKFTYQWSRESEIDTSIVWSPVLCLNSQNYSSWFGLGFPNKPTSVSVLLDFAVVINLLKPSGNFTYDQV
jgi:hypothetical protein